MSYNLKNTRNGKSILKIPKWPSLRSLAGVSILNCSQKTGACQAECNGQLLGYSSDNYLYKSLVNSCPAFFFFLEQPIDVFLLLFAVPSCISVPLYHDISLKKVHLKFCLLTCNVAEVLFTQLQVGKD